MSKIAFIFPGQGAQYVGMGKDFYEQHEISKAVIDKAEEVTKLPLKEILFEENDKINVTEYTQIAILATEIAILRVVESLGITPAVTAGLSLGEYGALVASKTIGEEEAFDLIRKRGIYMQEAYPVGGAMAAVLGAEASLIEEICEKVDGIVSIANYNCPGQIVITGEEKAVFDAMEALKEAGVKRCIPLKVSGPFHSALLKGAGEKLAQALELVSIQKPAVPYITNVTADYVTEVEPVKGLLASQVSSSVRWQQSIEKMLEDGVDTFVEIGPGKTLSGFMKKINKDVTCINIDKVEDLETLKELV